MGPVLDGTPVAVPHEAAPSIPFALGAAGTWWLVATAVFSLLIYYFVGVDQGAVSVFGDDAGLPVGVILFGVARRPSGAPGIT